MFHRRSSRSPGMSGPQELTGAATQGFWRSQGHKVSSVRTGRRSALPRGCTRSRVCGCVHDAMAELPGGIPVLGPSAHPFGSPSTSFWVLARAGLPNVPTCAGGIFAPSLLRLFAGRVTRLSFPKKLRAVDGNKSQHASTFPCTCCAICSS